jgi:hypothetical protein
MAKEKIYRPNKTYKIHSFYIKLFDACLSIYDRDKLTEYLIKEYFKYDNITKLPKYNKIELFEYMVDEMVKSQKPLTQLLSVLNETRIQELLDIYFKNGNLEKDKWRTAFNVRTSEYYKKLINELSKELDTISEVIELTIAYYINNCSESHFNLIKFSFERFIKDNPE